MMHTKKLVLLLALAACSPSPGVLEGGFGDEVGTSEGTGGSDTGGTTATSSESGTDAVDTSGTDTSELPVCECGPDELCVGTVVSDLCFEGFNYTLACVPKPSACAGDLCDPDCLLDACGNHTYCVPPCSNEPVDLWCAIDSLACDLAAQDCPEGEKCTPIVESGEAYDDARCVPIMGDAQPSEPCVLADGWVDDCAAGSFCTALVGQAGTCQGLCDGRGACPADAGCLIVNEGFLPICLPLCDAQGMCPGEQACTPAEDGAQVCAATAPSQQGSSCETLAACTPGFACRPADELPGCASAGCCTAYCETDDAQACAGLDGLACVPVYEQGMAPAGFEQLGVCVAP